MAKSLALLSCVVAFAACQRVGAQQVPAEDPLAPVSCFGILDAIGLAESSALALCGGAFTAAPGQCFVAAQNRHHELATTKILQLCTATTTLAPLSCYEQLDAEGVFTEDQAIAYCRATCPLGPSPPQSADPGCMSAGIARTELALQQVGELCRNSRDPGPVACYLQGRNTTQLANSQLIQLCAHVYSCQYVNAPAGAAAY
jgi:hypothetical protein